MTYSSNKNSALAPSRFVANTKFIFVELLILSIVIPTTIIVFKLAPIMFNFLWATTIYCLVIFILTKTDKWNEIWKWSAVTWENLKPVLIRWVLVSLFLLVFTWALFPDKLFLITKRLPADAG